MLRSLVLLLLVAEAACSLGGDSSRTPASMADAELAVAAVLDDFHRAAAEADEQRYFSHFAPTAVFLGTDPGERWRVEAFRRYAHPHFAAGKGWTYLPSDRHIAFDAAQQVAWFDEVVTHARYGACRGTGVLTRTAQGWRIQQYSLSLPIPNALFGEVAKQVAQHASTGSAAE